MPISTSFDPNLWDATISEIQREDKKLDRTNYFEKCLDVKSADSVSKHFKPGVRTANIAGLGAARKGGEWTAGENDELLRGYTKETFFSEYRLGVEVSRKLSDDDETGIIKNIATELLESFPRRKNIDASVIYDNFFNTTYYTGPDSLALGSASHKWVRDSTATYSNILSTSAPVSYSGLTDMITAMLSIKSARGYPVDVIKYGGNIQFMIQPADWAEMAKLTADLATFEPKSDMNTVNVLKSFSLSHFVNPWLTATGTAGSCYWFAFPGSSDKGFWMVDRIAPEFTRWVTEENGALRAMGYARYGIHIKETDKVFGSGN